MFVLPTVESANENSRVIFAFVEDKSTKSRVDPSMKSSEFWPRMSVFSLALTGVDVNI